jgi:hypothetical protein
MPLSQLLQAQGAQSEQVGGRCRNGGELAAASISPGSRMVAKVIPFW